MGGRVPWFIALTALCIFKCSTAPPAPEQVTGFPVGDAIYSGQMIDGKPDGQGSMRMWNGYEVSGTWREGGPMPGPGTIRRSDGGEIRGEWDFRRQILDHTQNFAYATMCIAGNCVDGSGILVDGRINLIYVGDFQRSKFHGLATVFWKQRREIRDDHEYLGIEKEYLILVGKFQQGVPIGFHVFCLRKFQFCRLMMDYLAPCGFRVESVDRYGFFENSQQPRVEELLDAARWLEPRAKIKESTDAILYFWNFATIRRGASCDAPPQSGL